ncbi:MAG: hypothetical protein ACKKL6_01695 [Candidatus Komeilibacteria bacterium]
MKIAICSSMSFAKEMIKAKEEMIELGHEVIIQDDVELHASGEIGDEDKWRKMEIDPFKVYFEEIKNADAILVINLDKHGVENYVGGNTLIEMAFAYVLDKKIFMMNPVPKLGYSDEIEAMRPVILNGDLNKII